MVSSFPIQIMERSRRTQSESKRKKKIVYRLEFGRSYKIVLEYEGDSNISYS